eukprot:6173692-Pleurochrysis_carterae.AAC.7
MDYSHTQTSCSSLSDEFGTSANPPIRGSCGHSPFRASLHAKLDSEVIAGILEAKATKTTLYAWLTMLGVVPSWPAT